MKIIAIIAGFALAVLFLASPAFAACFQNDSLGGFCYDPEAAKDAGYHAIGSYLLKINAGDNPAIILLPLFNAVREVNERRGNGYDILMEMDVTRYAIAHAVIEYFHRQIYRVTVDNLHINEEEGGGLATEYALQMGYALIDIMHFYDDRDNIAQRQPIEGEVLGDLKLIGPPVKATPPRGMFSPRSLEFSPQMFTH